MDDQETEARRKRDRLDLLQRQQVTFQQMVSMHTMFCALDVESKLDWRSLPREKRIKYDHERASYCIRSDYLGPIPRFDGKEFQIIFRISRARFERLRSDVGNLNDPFYCKIVDATNKKGASCEARLLLPLKTMAYGVPPHCFRDYFQMSKSLAKTCVHHFWKTIKRIYQTEYLRVPTSADLKNLSALHKSVHGVDGMFGSLDCMHTWWKNCPAGWKGQYYGKEKRRQLCGRLSVTITCGFGTPLTVTPEPFWIKTSGRTHLSLTCSSTALSAT